MENKTTNSTNAKLDALLVGATSATRGDYPEDEYNWRHYFMTALLAEKSDSPRHAKTAIYLEASGFTQVRQLTNLFIRLAWLTDYSMPPESKAQAFMHSAEVLMSLAEAQTGKRTSPIDPDGDSSYFDHPDVVHCAASLKWLASANARAHILEAKDLLHHLCPTLALSPKQYVDQEGADAWKL